MPNVSWSEIAATQDKWPTLRKRDILTLLDRAADEIRCLSGDLAHERGTNDEGYAAMNDALIKAQSEAERLRYANKRLVEANGELKNELVKVAIQRDTLDEEVAELNHELANQKPVTFGAAWKNILFGVR